MFFKVLKKIKTILLVAYFKMIYKNRVSFGAKLGILKGFNLKIGSFGEVKIGEDVFFNNYCSINSLKSIIIGNGCIFGEGVKIYDHNHKFKNKDIRIKEQGFNIGGIKIGENCWIGSNVVILKGVNIGRNVIIGANCVIYRSIPENSIVKCNQGLIIEKNYCDSIK